MDKTGRSIPKQFEAFMSYAHADDIHEEVRMFWERLSIAVRQHAGRDFGIFQDREDIRLGQNWQERITESLSGVTFFIPIITPSFFASSYCRHELRLFLEREKELKRNDLIFPIYFIQTPLMEDKVRQATNRLAQAVASHQYADWRELRYQPADSPEVRRAVDRLAARIAEVAGDLSNGAEEVLVVSELDGPYTSISEAIDAANVRDRILVQPGLYKEQLVVDKPIDIIGQGDRNDIVVQARRGSALVFDTVEGRVSNLTLEGSEGSANGVDIARGKLELNGCDISSQGGSCIIIRGNANPTLRENRIHGGKAYGVVVMPRGRGSIESNQVFANAKSGVAMAENSDPILRHNHIYNNREFGIRVDSNGHGTVEHNDIYNNRFSGVKINENGYLTLRKNRINGHGVYAVSMDFGGSGTIEDNDLSNNAFGASDIKPSAISLGLYPGLKLERNKEKRSSH